MLIDSLGILKKICEAKENQKLVCKNNNDDVECLVQASKILTLSRHTMERNSTHAHNI